MTEAERRAAAKAFAEYWKDRGDEKSDCQSFWLSFLREVLGVVEPEKTILFEERVKLDHTSFIDGHIPSTHVLIEQKKKGLDLRKPIPQSDGTRLTPFQQAQRYSAALPYSQRPRYIITCNFEEFLIYDMEKPTGEPESILLKDLGKEYYRLQFLVEEKSELLHQEEQVSIKAGELVGKLYDAILKQYINPESEETLRSLNMLCVRLVFCLYAEDAGIFGGHLKFHNYIKNFQAKDVRRALIDLFRVLDNALRMDWGSVVPKDELDYIMGNPPFVGYSLQTTEQKQDILSVYVDEKGKPYKTAGKIDYVAGWYFKASELMQRTKIRTAFVSTNSITQGEQVAGVWKPLYDRFGIHIDFAHRTFQWDSEASIKAHVHCVIVGFSNAYNAKDRQLYSGDRLQLVNNINFYLVAAENIFVEGKTKPVSSVPTLQNGGKPTEGGFLILTEEEKDELLAKEPQAQEFLRPYMMGKDFINRKPRYCLWLVAANPALLKKCPLVLQRVENVRNYRLSSPKEATQKKALTPTLFDEVRECKTDYIAIPKVSSERRRYIPMEYLSSQIIPGDKLFMIEGASLYHLGVLTSNVHMAWMRAVCGRLKSDYSYSNTIVYNNFPWPTPTEEQKKKIEETAQAILDARALYPDCSLADLYDEITMPPELRKAHQANDKAVMQAYGFWGKLNTESECVAELMKLYQKLVNG